MAESKDPDFIHKEFPKKFARDDFWAQIKRTVNGKPVPEHEINLIVDQIKRHMRFSPTSHLLDIGCGNGALASRLFPDIARYTGVDFSAYLLGIANEYFKPGPDINYIEDDASSFVANHAPDRTVDKVLIYGCMSYFRREEFPVLLKNIGQRFQSADVIFVGNVPDINKADEFFAARNIACYELDNSQTPIGIWWDPAELIKLGEQMGFSAQCARMPADFYGHPYRFDVIYRKSA